MAHSARRRAGCACCPGLAAQWKRGLFYEWVETQAPAETPHLCLYRARLQCLFLWVLFPLGVLPPVLRGLINPTVNSAVGVAWKVALAIAGAFLPTWVLAGATPADVEKRVWYAGIATSIIAASTIMDVIVRFEGLISNSAVILPIMGVLCQQLLGDRWASYVLVPGVSAMVTIAYFFTPDCAYSENNGAGSRVVFLLALCWTTFMLNNGFTHVWSFAMERERQHARANNSFLSVMSHELRTPMQGIVALVDMMDQNLLHEDSEEHGSTLRMFNSSVESLSEMYGSLIDRAMVDRNETPVAEVFKPKQLMLETWGLSLSLSHPKDLSSHTVPPVYDTPLDAPDTRPKSHLPAMPASRDNLVVDLDCSGVEGNTCLLGYPTLLETVMHRFKALARAARGSLSGRQPDDACVQVQVELHPVDEWAALTTGWVRNGGWDTDTAPHVRDPAETVSTSSTMRRDVFFPAHADKRRDDPLPPPVSAELQAAGGLVARLLMVRMEVPGMDVPEERDEQAKLFSLRHTYGGANEQSRLRYAGGGVKNTIDLHVCGMSATRMRGRIGCRPKMGAVTVAEFWVCLPVWVCELDTDTSECVYDQYVSNGSVDTADPPQLSPQSVRRELKTDSLQQVDGTDVNGSGFEDHDEAVEEVKAGAVGSSSSGTKETSLHAARPPTAPRTRGTCTVLVVDDTPMNLLVMERMVETCGFMCITAVDGAEAVNMFSDMASSTSQPANTGPGPDDTDTEYEDVPRLASTAPHVDLILMDLQMPAMDGFTATRRLRALGVRAPILAWSAGAIAADVRRAKQGGMQGYYPKPLSLKLLAKLVPAHLKQPDTWLAVR